MLRTAFDKLFFIQRTNRLFYLAKQGTYLSLFLIPQIETRFAPIDNDMRFLKIVTVLFLISTQIYSAQTLLTPYLNVKTEPTKKTTVTTNAFGITLKKNWSKNNEIENNMSYTKTNINQESNAYSFKNDSEYSSIENRLAYSRKVNDHFQLRAKVITAFNYDEKASWNDFLLLGGILIDYKINPHHSLSGGILRSTALGTPKIHPSFTYHFQANDKLKAAIGFPESQISYSNNSRNVFFWNHSYEGNQFNTNNGTGTFTFSQINSSLNYERQIDERWKANFKCGYSFQKDYKSTSSLDNSISLPIKDGYLLAIGLQYKL